MAVLQGNVEIGKDGLPYIPDGFQKLRRDAFRIEVEHAQPEKTVQAGKAAKQGREVLSSRVRVLRVVSEILGDEHEFFYAGSQKIPGFSHDFVHGTRFEWAAYGGNGAEGTVMAASFGYLEPCVGGWTGKDAPRNFSFLYSQLFPDTVRPAQHISRGDPEIHFRKLPGQFLGSVTADHAASNGKKGPVFDILEVTYDLEDGVYGFLDRGSDEAAGIDEDKTGLSYVLSLGNGHAETSEKFFGVHPVFGTAEAFAPHGEGSRRLAAGGRGSTEMLRIFFHNFQRMR